MRITPWLAALGLGAAFPAPVPAQEIAPGTAVSFLPGTCSSLIVAGRDVTDKCKPVAITTSYANGRSSLMFIIGEEGMVSFHGVDTKTVGAAGRLDVQQMTLVDHGGVNVRKIPVSGQCVYSDPYKGPAHIICQASNSDARYAADLTTDGAPPTVTKM